MESIYILQSSLLMIFLCIGIYVYLRQEFDPQAGCKYIIIDIKDYLIIVLYYNSVLIRLNIIDQENMHRN